MGKIIRKISAAFLACILMAPASSVTAAELAIKVLTEPKLDSDVYLFSTNQYSGFSEGLVIFDQYDWEAEDFHKGFVYVDTNLDVVIGPLPRDTFSRGDPFSGGLAKVSSWDHEDGFIDRTGNFVIPLKKFYSINDFYDGLIPVSTGTTQYGYMDVTGEIVIPLQYTNVDNFSSVFEGLGRVYIYGEGCGFVDKTGQVVIPLEYEDIHYESGEGLAGALKDGQWRYIDSGGNVMFSVAYESKNYRPGVFTNGFAVIRDGAGDPFRDGDKSDPYRYGFIDKTGSVVVPLIYDGVADFSEGLAFARKDGKVGCINTAGEVVIPFEYQRASKFEGGNADTAKDGKYGIIDTQGNVLVPFQYDYMKRLSGDLFIVGEGVKPPSVGYDPFYYTKYGIINANNELVVPLIYDHIDDTHDRVALVRTDSKYGYIDVADGTVLAEPEYSDASPFYDGLALVQKEGKWGVLQLQ